MVQAAPDRLTGPEGADEGQDSSALSNAMHTEQLLALDGSFLSVWSQNLTVDKGWDLDNPRLTGDFDGDSRDDVVGFGNQDVYVGISSGAAFSLSSWTDQEFTYDTGWSVFQHPRLVGDFNGDGKDDVVGFGDQNVWVGISNGSAFSLSVWGRDLTYNKGWRVYKHPRFVGDFNGDGKDDIVGFGNNNVVVGISSGTDFSFSSWSQDLTYNKGWRLERHVRLVGDFDGDGKDDIVGCGNQHVTFGMSDGSAFSLSSWTELAFTYNRGWRVERNPRLVGDWNGDGKDDLVGFGEQHVWVGISDGSALSLKVWGQDLTYDRGWRVEKHPRLVGDMNGDGRDDIVGFGNKNVRVGISSGSDFSFSSWTNQEFTYDTGWRVDPHPRLLADFNGDGEDDIVGFGDLNVWVGISGPPYRAFLPYVTRP